MGGRGQCLGGPLRETIIMNKLLEHQRRPIEQAIGDYPELVVEEALQMLKDGGM